ncbi:MAG TPA: hypothetical protein VJ843_01310 [Candidatus Saccharimonadales bacterium]|nr:hypothetical protein [Candidatus Saccharimonadales bacterium]
MTTVFGFLAFASLAAFLITKFAFKRDEGFYFLVLWGIFATLNRVFSHEWVLASISAALLVIATVGVSGMFRKKSK